MSAVIIALIGYQHIGETAACSISADKDSSSCSTIFFYLYIDEFQNFATKRFVEILSKARKYKLHVIMAEQSHAQQDMERVVQTMLNNAGTVVSFRTGNNLDEALLLPRFGLLVKEGDMNNLPTCNFYIRIQPLQLIAAMSGETLLIQSPIC